MKNLSLILFAVWISFALVSCKDYNQLVSFNIETEDQLVINQIPDSILTDTFPNNDFIDILFEEDFAFSDLKKFETNKTRPANVEKVEKFNLLLRIDSGASNFRWAQGLNIYMLSPTNAFAELKLLDVPIPPINENAINLELLPTSEVMMNAMIRDKYKFRIDFQLINPMPDTIYMTAKMYFRVKAMPID
jgi:hypothetical protein